MGKRANHDGDGGGERWTKRGRGGGGKGGGGGGGGGKGGGGKGGGRGGGYRPRGGDGHDGNGGGRGNWRLDNFDKPSSDAHERAASARYMIHNTSSVLFARSALLPPSIPPDSCAPRHRRSSRNRRARHCRGSSRGLPQTSKHTLPDDAAPASPPLPPLPPRLNI
jgi:hypothetical protein